LNAVFMGLGMLTSLGIEVSGGVDSCDLNALVPKAMLRWQKKEPRLAQHRLLIERRGQELEVTLSNAQGTPLLRRKLPYEAAACTPTSDRIALVVDNFFIDFAKSGAWDEGKTELPIKALAQIKTKKTSSSMLRPRTAIPIADSSQKTDSIKVESQPPTEHKAALWLTAIGTAETNLGDLALRFGGQLKLKLVLDHLELMVAAGSAGLLHQEIKNTDGVIIGEIRARPAYLIAGPGGCVHGDQQELCLNVLGGQEFFFGEAALTGKDAATLNKKQWLLEGGLDYAYRLVANIHAHLGGKLGFRPGEEAFAVPNSPSRLELSGWTWSAYSGLSFRFYSFGN
jgi:hypothetical protein